MRTPTVRIGALFPCACLRQTSQAPHLCRELACPSNRHAARDPLIALENPRVLRSIFAIVLAQISVLLCASALGGHVVHQLLDPEDPGRVMAVAVATPMARGGMSQVVTAHLASTSSVSQPLLSNASRTALAREGTPMELVRQMRAGDDQGIPGPHLQKIVAAELDRLDPAAAQVLRSETVPTLALGETMPQLIARYRSMVRTIALVALALGLLTAAIALMAARNPDKILNIVGWGLVVDALVASLLFFAVAPLLAAQGVTNTFATTLQLMVDRQQATLLIPLMLASFAGLAVLIIRAWTEAHYAATNMHLVRERAASERRQAQRRYQPA